MAKLGYFIEKGYGGFKADIDEEYKWYIRSYDNGSLEGCARLGSLLINKKFSQYNGEDGLKFIIYSCNNNDRTGLNIYGSVFGNGLEGYQKDFSKAFYYVKRAADLGLHIAIFNVGHLYRKGFGISKDINKAIKYCQLALEEGCPNGAEELADIYNDPESGVYDKSKSLQYYKLANELGIKSLQEKIDTISKVESTC